MCVDYTNWSERNTLRWASPGATVSGMKSRPTEKDDEEQIEIRCPKCKELVTIPKTEADARMRATCSRGHTFEIARAI